MSSDSIQANANSLARSGSIQTIKVDTIPIDKCANIPGMQETISESLYLQNGNCYTLYNKTASQGCPALPGQVERRDVVLSPMPDDSRSPAPVLNKIVSGCNLGYVGYYIIDENGTFIPVEPQFKNKGRVYTMNTGYIVIRVNIPAGIIVAPMSDENNHRHSVLEDEYDAKINTAVMYGMWVRTLLSPDRIMQVAFGTPNVPSRQTAFDFSFINTAHAQSGSPKPSYRVDDFKQFIKEAAEALRKMDEDRDGNVSFRELDRNFRGFVEAVMRDCKRQGFDSKQCRKVRSSLNSTGDAFNWAVAILYPGWTATPVVITVDDINDLEGNGSLWTRS
jgi:hypothetical protein